MKTVWVVIRIFDGLPGQPAVYSSLQKAKKAFKQYTGTSYSRLEKYPEMNTFELLGKRYADCDIYKVRIDAP